MGGMGGMGGMDFSVLLFYLIVFDYLLFLFS